MFKMCLPKQDLKKCVWKQSFRLPQIVEVCQTTGVRAQADCLIRRVGSVGPGGAAACKRRKQAVWWEKRWEQERRAQLLGAAQGKKLVRRGQFMLG